MPAPASAPAPGGAQTAIRRIIVVVILFALVVTAAIGVAGLLERALGAGRVVVDDGALLARSLAFTFIAGPLAGLLWWWQRRRLGDPAERASVAWVLYLTAMSLVALVVATVALATCLAAAIGGEWRPGDLAAALVWGGVWLWHGWMRRSRVTGPTRMAEVPVVLGAAYGLAVAAIGLIAVLTVLLGEAFGDLTPVLASSHSWGVSALQALVWAVIGTAAWGWHWLGERVRDASGVFAAVVLVIVTGVSAAAALFAAGTIVWVVLRMLLDTDPLAEVVDPLDAAIATALVAGIVWVYHATVVATRSEAIRRSLRLVVSGVALIGAASGFGVVVNALLATFGDAVAGEDPRTLLLGGLAALLIGGPVWWFAWRPTRPVTADVAAGTARRVYLVTVFGASAIVGIVTVLIIGFRLFEFAIDDVAASALVERIRGPLGLLAATALVFGYHFAVWRRDRVLARGHAPVAVPRLVVVAEGDPGDLARARRSATGAHVTVWRASGPGVTAADVAAVAAELPEVAAPRVLVVAREGGGVQVIPLAE